MDKVAITNLQQQSVPNIIEQLATLDRESLVELSAQETGSKAPRATLQAAIDKQLAVLDAAAEGGDTGASDADKPAAAAAAVVAKSEKPAAEPPPKLTKSDWRHPDYHGPLNGQQANWRVRNIKPAAKVITK